MPNEVNNPEEGSMADEVNNPEEGSMADEANNPEEGSMADEANNPEEGRIADETNNPEEGSMADEANNPEERGMADEANNPEEGGMADGTMKRLFESAKELRTAVMVGAVLVATLAFQATVTPPGGFWQEDRGTNDDHRRKHHTAGHPIWGDQNPSQYQNFMTFSYFAFGFSVFTIMTTLLSIADWKREWLFMFACVAFFLSLWFLLAAFIVSRRFEG